ncbi:MAG: NTP transferase domain-containing protein, partial [Candidatus Omnitrophica bacterium]|nr:NTP transferase domain-containing protein [Candidatus Omnitrophota bacterium]
MRDVLCLVLGGGRGQRLYPLTKDRSKPAVPFAGKFRLVDVPISNSLNSECNHIYVLTQYNSESLNKHVNKTYKLDAFSQGFVEIMAAEQSIDSADWFQGSADAVRRCLKHFNYPGIKYILVLSGDQLYKMDFRKLLSLHQQKKAEITIACSPVKASDVKEFGIMCTDSTGRINSFVEKPQTEDEVIQMMIEKNHQHFYLANMGIYLFNKETLRDILVNNQKTDFGREVIPDSFNSKKTYAYVHEGYWRDIGTIKSFYEENLSFTEPVPPLDLFDEAWPIFTRPRYLPPAKIEDCYLDRVMVGDGSLMQKCSIKNSVIGLRSRISPGADIKDSIIMGGDFYQSLDNIDSDRKAGTPPIGIGRKTVIKKAIIDK